MSFTERLLLPEGTRVMPLMTRQATVDGQRKQIFSGEPGTVVRPAKDIYSRLTVEYDCGSQVSYLPHEVVPCDGECPFDLRSCIVLRTRIGSHAHGIAHDDSDDDFRGVFVSPSELHWSLNYTPRRIEYLRDGVDELYYEVGGFVRRLLTGDPMVVETLFSHIVLEADNVGSMLLGMRQRFLTRPALMGFPYFLRNQMKDYNRRNRRGKPVKAKGLMHSLRLAVAARRALETGEFTLEARENADTFVAIREGKWTFERVNQAVHFELRHFEDALDDSPLPEQPATEAADQILIFARAEFARRWLEKNSKGALDEPLSAPLVQEGQRGVHA